MNAMQRFFKMILPQQWGESMETDSRTWMMRCPCGFEQSVWEAGGIRWKAWGNPRNLMRCSNCGKTTWHTTYRRE